MAAGVPGCFTLKGHWQDQPIHSGEASLMSPCVKDDFTHERTIPNWLDPICERSFFVRRASPKKAGMDSRRTGYTNGLNCDS